MKRIILSLGMTLLGVLAFAQADLQTVAIVRLTKSEPISVRQFRIQVEQVERQSGETLTAAQRRQILDSMINERLALQAAERDKIVVSEAEVNQQIQILRNNMGQEIGRQLTDAEFSTFLRNETGMELPAVRDHVRRQYTVQKYLNTTKQAVIQSARAPTEAEILNFYNLNKAQFVRPDTVRISMIQIPLGTTAEERTKSKTLADQLAREIGSAPAKFDEAVIRSQGANSGYQGGDAGYLPRNAQAQQLVGPALLEAAFNLKQGEVSRLIETPQGYHILKITETYEMKNLAMNDVIQPGTRLTVHDYIAGGLTEERQAEVFNRAQQELIADLRKNNPFQIFENNLTW